NKDIDAVVVATPASTHYRIVKDALEAGKDVLAEKPLTLIPEESFDLAETAKKEKKILMVGHTFLFNSGIAKLKECVDNGELGKIYYMNATRTHLGLVRNDVNAIWDLAPHDVSIFNYLLGKSPISVNAIGSCHLKDDREDVAFINLIYPDDVIANIHVSWADSNKERTVRVVGSESRVVFNDMDNLERIKIYKKGIKVSEEYDDFGEFQLHLRDGDIVSPKIPTAEPLKEECVYFLDCVRTRKKPITDGMNGYDVVKVMCAIERSIKNKGKIEIV
ncbi:MAG: Gfo/Idh/MocA family oxidoreductase, partial [Candidatus Heimdallarchaeota archaeon]|nr:Gfo/Idh/MocA family oxidoreductase [Candidatus Heimdallarchaeota archaeon]